MGKTFKAALASGSAIVNPAEALITGAATPAVAPKAQTKKEKPVSVEAEEEVSTPKEAKTRRLQSLLKPSLYEYLKRSAARKGISVNDRLNTLLEEAKAGEEG